MRHQSPKSSVPDHWNLPDPETVAARRWWGKALWWMIAIGGMALLVHLIVSAAHASEAIKPPFAARFCLDHAEYCTKTAPAIVSSDNLAVLETINRAVNREFDPAPNDLASARHPWMILQESARASCHDYAVTKLARLVQVGIPLGALSLAYLHLDRDAPQMGHLVLLAQTTRGIYVLDNLTNTLWHPEEENGYRWISRQAFGDPQDWEVVT